MRKNLKLLVSSALVALTGIQVAHGMEHDGQKCREEISPPHENGVSIQMPQEQIQQLAQVEGADKEPAKKPQEAEGVRLPFGLKLVTMVDEDARAAAERVAPWDITWAQLLSTVKSNEYR